MRFQLKGIAGKWSVYDGAGNQVGVVRLSMGQKLEYQCGEKRQAFDICRKGNEVRLEQAGTAFFSGQVLYFDEENGGPVPKSLFCPPVPEKMKFGREGEAWMLRQLPNRNIEIYYNGMQAGILKGMVVGTKVLEWSGDEALLERGLLCFALGVYMTEDDTVYAV